MPRTPPPHFHTNNLHITNPPFSHTLISIPQFFNPTTPYSHKHKPYPFIYHCRLISSDLCNGASIIHRVTGFGLFFEVQFTACRNLYEAWCTLSHLIHPAYMEFACLLGQQESVFFSTTNKLSSPLNAMIFNHWSRNLFHIGLSKIIGNHDPKMLMEDR